MSVFSIIPMFIGVFGGVICYRAYMKSLQLLAARKRVVVAQTHQEQLEAHNQNVIQDSLRYVDNDTPYETLR
jgi:hypothetical protein